jgi:hypothetical protein
MNFDMIPWSWELDKLSEDELIMLFIYRCMIDAYVPPSMWSRLPT